MKPTKSILILLSLFLIFSCETPEEPDTTPPTVTITYPVDGSFVSEIINITCISTDNQGVKEVELWIDGICAYTEIYEDYVGLEAQTCGYYFEDNQSVDFLE